MEAIQAIIFDKHKWNKKESKKWLKEHKYRPIKEAHVTANFIRYRLRSPRNFNRFITHKVNGGIDFIIGFKK